MAAKNSRDLSLQATIPRIVPYTLPPDVIPGLPDVIGAVKGIKLTTNGNSFVETTSTVSPLTLTITAEFVALTTPGSITWTPSGVTLSGSGMTRTVLGTTMTGASATVEASVTDAADGTTYVQRINFVKAAMGVDGDTGASRFIAYKADSYSTPPATPGTTTNGAIPSGWSGNPVSVSTGQAQWQVDGIQPAGSTTTTWSTPYLSFFKVGTLSAITVNTGALSVDDSLTMGTTGAIMGGKTSYASSAAGFFLGWNGSYYVFNVGDGSNYLKFNGTGLEIRGNITGVSNIDITGSAYFAGNSTAGGFNAVMHIVNAAGASMGLRVTGNGGEGVYATTNSVSGQAAVRGLANSFGVGVSGQATSSGIGVSADNPGGIALDIVGTMRWAGYNYAAPDGVSSTQFFCKNGTWATAGVTFTPVEQGGGSGMLGNKVRIGWNGSQLRAQVDSTPFTMWPIDITGYAGTAGDAYTLNGYSAVALATYVYNTINSDASFVRTGTTYTISIPSLGGSWPGYLT